MTTTKSTYAFLCLVLATATFLVSPAAHAAMTEADCVVNFTKADVNNDGVVTEEEAGRYFASYRIGNKTVADNKLARDQFLTDCQAGVFDEAAIEEGAPFEGANSFTEGQAKDRALARGMTDVSALTKDDKGIWRGTAKMGDKNINIAVDYKGNVVTQPFAL